MNLRRALWRMDVASPASACCLRFSVRSANSRASNTKSATFPSPRRLIVAISYNSDVGDAWKYADESRYSSKFADQSIRLGVNYIVYAMSH